MNPPRAQRKNAKIGLVLIGGASEGGGGTGRRFARLFQHLQCAASRPDASPSDVWLITTAPFLELMKRSSIPIDPNHNVIYFEGEPGTPDASTMTKLLAYRESSLRLAALVSEHEFDLIHIPIPNLIYAPYLLRSPARARHVFSMTAAVGSFESMGWKSQLLYRIGFECCDAIDTLYSDIGTRFPSYARKLHVSPCSFTDYSRYRPADVKEKWIVFAGRLEAFKNPQLFIEATHLAADTLREHGWKCLMFGDGELRTRVEEQIVRYEISDLIRLDQVPDLSPTLGRSRIFTSIQRTENYPSQVLLEAMAAGNAVIATDVGDTRKIVDENVGLLFAPQTAANLAHALRTLVTDDVLCGRLASNARARILDQHTINRFADYMNELWRVTLTENSPTPRPSWTRIVRIVASAAARLKFA